jgi:hypothetical protein
MIRTGAGIYRQSTDEPPRGRQSPIPYAGSAVVQGVNPMTPGPPTAEPGNAPQPMKFRPIPISGRSESSVTAFFIQYSYQLIQIA